LGVGFLVGVGDGDGVGEGVSVGIDVGLDEDVASARTFFSSFGRFIIYKVTTSPNRTRRRIDKMKFFIRVILALLSSVLEVFNLLKSVDRVFPFFVRAPEMLTAGSSDYVIAFLPFNYHHSL
jgi:hypothetical protein